jgi:hypothetical protein
MRTTLALAGASLLLLAPTSLAASRATAAPTGPRAPVAAARSVSTVPQAVNGPTVSETFRAAVAALPVRAEHRAGYVRTKFRLWDDVDHDCQDTRSEVLRQESRTRVTGRCTVTRGRWTSQYDGKVFTRAAGLDIDHLVPLAEAWDSGARSWKAARREAYANDLKDSRTLIAVSASANRSKGDGDPSDWLPAQKRCRYALQWTIVKTRWSLSVDSAEKAVLVRFAGACASTRFTTHLARVRGTASSSGTSSGGTSSGGTSSGGGLDPHFGTCTEAKAHGYGPYYRGRDPEYSWYEDRDGDGVVCE